MEGYRGPETLTMFYEKKHPRGRRNFGVAGVSDRIASLILAHPIRDSLSETFCAEATVRSMVHSYWPDAKRGDRWFRKDKCWRAYNDSSAESLRKSSAPLVVRTDWRCAYESLAFRRVVRMFETGSPENKLVARILQAWGIHQSGLPHGLLFSHTIAQMILCELDMRCAGVGMRYDRYVDDYRFYPSKELAARDALNDLKAMGKEFGFELNARKTRMARDEDAVWICHDVDWRGFPFQRYVGLPTTGSIGSYEDGGSSLPCDDIEGLVDCLFGSCWEALDISAIRAVLRTAGKAGYWVGDEQFLSAYFANPGARRYMSEYGCDCDKYSLLVAAPQCVSDWSDHLLECGLKKSPHGCELDDELTSLSEKVLRTCDWRLPQWYLAGEVALRCRRKTLLELVTEGYSDHMPDFARLMVLLCATGLAGKKGNRVRSHALARGLGPWREAVNAYLC